jgi:long-chain acyl-CoA synthetase
MEQRTIAALWRNACARDPGRTAYLAERDGGWAPVSGDEAARRVDDIANGLLALGVSKGDAFAILASTSVEWCLFDFALALVGAVGAPIYANCSPHDCAYVLEHSEALGVLVDDDAEQAKVDAARAGLPRLRHVLTFADLPRLEASGRDYAAENPDALDRAAAAVGEEDLFTYQYTSGTTGPPKACMVRHRNYYEMTAVLDELPGFVEETDTMLLYLPLAHNFGRLMHLEAAFAGFTLVPLRDPLRAGEALVEVRPTVFPSVPRLFEKAHAAVLARLDEASAPRRRLAEWALSVGREASRLRQAGRPLPRSLARRLRLADRLVYSKVKDRFGGRLRIAISGGAPLSPEIAEFFHAFGVLILEGYGLSECTTACSVNWPGRFRFGTVGPLLPGFEARFDGDGELLVRSETVFAGYYRDKEATHAVLDGDGWLRTGDIGRIDEDGFLMITDRKKDILVTAGGKKIAPQNIENELKGSKYVSQALVVGDRRPYVSALIALDEAEVAKADGDIEALIQSVVDDVNAQHSRHEQIKRFAIVPRDFSADEGEVTPTLKLRRRVVQEHFAAEIEKLYAD